MVWLVNEINVGCGSTTPTPPNLKYSSETKIRIRKISEWDPSFKPHSGLAYIFVTDCKEKHWIPSDNSISLID